MYIAIAQSGPDNTGKTSTFRIMYEMLLQQHPDAEIDYLLDHGEDIRAVATIDDVQIGIESQGDPWKKAARLEPSLALFVRLQCDVIICATRTFGGTVDAVRCLEDDGYEVMLRPRTREAGAVAQRHRNLAEAKWIIRRINSIVGAAIA
jgi:hypothetical protein